MHAACTLPEGRGRSRSVDCLCSHGTGGRFPPLFDLPSTVLKATPLHCAAEVGNSAQLEVLLKLGVDANGENAYGDTPLLVACANNQAECVKLLLEHNADPTKANHKKQNALHMAVAGLGKALRSEEGKENENVEEKLLVAKQLLEDPKVPLAKRIDPNHADANGQTPLHHIAVMKERPATVALAKLLLASGGKAKVMDASGKRPSELGAGRATPRGELTAYRSATSCWCWARFIRSKCGTYNRPGM